MKLQAGTTMNANPHIDDLEAPSIQGDEDDAGKALRLLRLRAEAEAAGDTLRAAQIDWCIGWLGYKRYSQF